MSRHMYDIAEIIDTNYGKRALKDKALFEKIIEHRAKYTPVKSVDYNNLELKRLVIIPNNEILKLFEKDYKQMQENMIYGEQTAFNKIIEKLKKITS